MKKETIQSTIDFWSPRYGHTLSEEEAIEIIQNLRRFIDLFAEVDVSIRQKEAKEKPHHSES